MHVVMHFFHARLTREFNKVWVWVWVQIVGFKDINQTNLWKSHWICLNLRKILDKRGVEMSTSVHPRWCSRRLHRHKTNLTLNCNLVYWFEITTWYRRHHQLPCRKRILWAVLTAANDRQLHHVGLAAGCRTHPSELYWHVLTTCTDTDLVVCSEHTHQSFIDTFWQPVQTQTS